MPQKPARRRRSCAAAFALATLLSARLALGAEAPAGTNPPAATTPASKAEDFGPTEAAQIRQRWWLTGLIVVLVGVGAVYRFRKNPFTQGGD